MERKDAGYEKRLKVKPNRDKIKKFESISRKFLLEQAETRKKLVEQGRLEDAIINILSIVDQATVFYLSHHLGISEQKIKPIIEKLAGEGKISIEETYEFTDG